MAEIDCTTGWSEKDHLNVSMTNRIHCSMLQSHGNRHLPSHQGNPLKFGQKVRRNVTSVQNIVDKSITIRCVGNDGGPEQSLQFITTQHLACASCDDFAEGHRFVGEDELDTVGGHLVRIAGEDAFALVDEGGEEWIGSAGEAVVEVVLAHVGAVDLTQRVGVIRSAGVR